MERSHKGYQEARQAQLRAQTQLEILEERAARAEGQAVVLAGEARESGRGLPELLGKLDLRERDHAKLRERREQQRQEDLSRAREEHARSRAVREMDKSRLEARIRELGEPGGAQASSRRAAELRLEQTQAGRAAAEERAQKLEREAKEELARLREAHEQEMAALWEEAEARAVLASEQELENRRREAEQEQAQERHGAVAKLGEELGELRRRLLSAEEERDEAEDAFQALEEQLKEDRRLGREEDERLRELAQTYDATRRASSFLAAASPVSSVGIQRPEIAALLAELQAREAPLLSLRLAFAKKVAELEEQRRTLEAKKAQVEDTEVGLRQERFRAEALVAEIDRYALEFGEAGRAQEMLFEVLLEAQRMLNLARTSLQRERREKEEVEKLLEHERNRARLLLEVLRHFKEKVQLLPPASGVPSLGEDGLVVAGRAPVRVA